jgi:chromatin segregation and condensation protein Rec8/ScpA/Scc1 (kleisin family)
MFIPLLFLVPRGRCNLWQEEFFGDILVRIFRAAEGSETVGTDTTPA